MSSLQSIDPWVFIAVLLLVVAGGYGFFVRWCAYSPAVPRDQLNQLTVGMTTEEVIRLLGQPRLRRALPDDLREWVYGPPMKRHVLMLQFSPEGKLQAFAHAVPGGHIQAAAIHNQQ